MVGGRQLQCLRHIGQRHLVAAFPLEIYRHAAIKNIHALNDAEAPGLVEAQDTGFERQQQIQPAKTFGNRHRRLETRVRHEALQLARRRERALRQLHPERALLGHAGPPRRAAADTLDRRNDGAALNQPIEQQLRPRIGLFQSPLSNLGIQKIQ